MNDAQVLINAILKGDFQAIPALLDELADPVLIKQWKMLTQKKRPWVNLPARRAALFLTEIFRRCGLVTLSTKASTHLAFCQLIAAVAGYAVHLSHQNWFDNGGRFDVSEFHAQ